MRQANRAASLSPLRAARKLSIRAVVVSRSAQFTLLASTKKGNRPSFSRSARPELAVPLYEEFIRQLTADLGRSIQTGQFGADMKVSLTNDGPVTILLDSKSRE